MLKKGVGRGQVIVLENDGTGRSVLALLALANLNSEIVLIDNGSLLGRYQSKLPTIDFVLVTGKERASSSHRVVDLSDELRAMSRVDLDIGLTNVREQIDLRAWFEQERALAILSSGTRTGLPSVVWKSGADVLENSLATSDLLGYTSGDVFLPLLPLSGQYGSSVVLISMVLGADLVLSSRTRISEAIRTISRHNVTAVDASPPVYQALVGAVAKKPELIPSIDSVRVWGVGGALLSPLLQNDFSAMSGRSLIDGYGMAQLGNVGFIDECAVESGLRLVSTYKMRIVGPDGAEVGEGDTGRILIRRADQNDLANLETDAEGWFDTGDLGRVRSERLFVLGREGAITRNGYTFNLAELSGRLSANGVNGHVVPVKANRVDAFWLVVEDPLYRSRSYWRRRVSEVLDEHEIPDHIEVLRKLPMNAGGKVSDSKLAQFAQALYAGRKTSLEAEEPRAAAMMRVAISHKEALYAALSGWTDPTTITAEYSALLATLQNAAGEMALHKPAGEPPVFVFMPANAILESFALYCLIPALWASKVSVRPSRGTANIVNTLVSIFDNATDGKVSVETTDQALFVQKCAAEPAVVLFTGRRSNAELVGKRLSRQHLFMFFGKGYNPTVVTADANVRQAARETVRARLFNGGQDCLAPDIVFVESSISQEFNKALQDELAAFLNQVQGALPALREDSVMLGAISYLLEHGDNITLGGAVNYAARTIEPAIVFFDGIHGIKPVEHFSPIFTVGRYETFDEVMTALLSPPYLENALGVTLYGVEDKHASRLAASYMVSSDQSLGSSSASYEAFGGYGPESGYTVYDGKRVLGPINITEAVANYWISREPLRAAGQLEDLHE
ncbi:aldehyde dehydrogenase family protein [Arthrobacter sp. ISL-69]|nr:aldehyde dehydrogenase family protein [Arthrobacter sp. ISL-69]